MEYGTHSDLMEKKGLYYELVMAQQRKEKVDEEGSSDDEVPDRSDHQRKNRSGLIFSKNDFIQICHVINVQRHFYL